MAAYFEGTSARAKLLDLGTGAKWTVTDLVGKTAKWPDAD